MVNGKNKPALLDVPMAARFMIGCGCLVAGWGSDSWAASVTVPLDFKVVETVDGAEVVAAFDFGAMFSEIESVTFSFVMEEGFEGSFVTTGNSSYDRSLRLELRDQAGLPASGCSEICRVHNIGTVPAGELTSYEFSPRFVRVLDPTDVEPPIEAGGTPTIPGAINFFDVLTFDPNAIYRSVWPDVVVDGAGQMAVADIFSATTHPLPTGVVTSSSTTSLAPDITMATLTITGTLVPEPSALICACVLVGMGVASACRGSRQSS